MLPSHTRIEVQEPNQAGEARRAAARHSHTAGLNETDAGRVAVITTELGNNLARHAKGGEILISSGPGVVNVFSIDRGPGMANIAICMADGYSTGGTAGQGLGAVRRMASSFDCYSNTPAGTVIVCQILPTGDRTTPENRFGYINIAVRGEPVCGDVASVTAIDGALSFLIADGLGHGHHANAAATEAASVFDASAALMPGVILESIHNRLRSTRGAAAAAARVDLKSGLLRYAGIGNIAGSLASHDGSRGLTSHNGTLGHQIRKVQEFDYPVAPGALLILHSDGLGTRWDLSGYPGLTTRHPAIIAAVLYRDFVRGRDDVAVLVARPRPIGA